MTRDKIYSECFDEIVRQVTINFKKRGLFLSLIRDYFRDLETFVKKQYFSSISLRIRSQVSIRTQIKQLNSEIETLSEDNVKLEEELVKKQNRIEDTHEYHRSKMKVKCF